MFVYLKKISTSHATQVLLGFLLLAIGTEISIPFYAIPFTLVSLFVYFMALTFPKKSAVIAVIAFVAFRSFNVSSSSGLPIFLGVTYGYLIGFILCTFLMVNIRHKVSPLKACLAGSSVLFLCGVIWLAAFIGLEKAIYTGLIPFIVTDFAKILLATSCAAMIKNA